MAGVNSMPSPEGRALPNSDDSCQKLLLRIAAKASERGGTASLIQFFCQATREFFHASGVYFWRRHTGDELVGEQADGKLAELFIGIRLQFQDNANTAEAVRLRRTIIVDPLHLSQTIPALRQFGARSLMAAPLVVFDEVIGAATFLHDSDEDFFNDDLAAKATILAVQLGSLLEAVRLGEASREEHRRAEILADVAHVLHGTPDVASVIEALADRLRLLLRTRLVCVLLRREGPFELKAVSAETPQLATSARARHDRQTLRFAADLAQRAVAAGEPITLALGADSHSLGTLVSPGMLIVAPLRSSRTQGAILVYPRPDGPFTAEEKALVSAIAGFGAVALAHAELYSTAHAQANELQQLLAISSELSSSSDLEHFLQSFVTHAADFLSFGRCFIALLENDQFRVRYGVANGAPASADVLFPEGVATKALRAKEVFWTDDAKRTPGANLEVVDQYQVRQFLAVPLLGSSGKVLGMFGVLDRLDGIGISQEDIRRARALSNQAAVMLEVARNLHLSEQHRRRAEALIGLAREINGALRLEEFGRRFVTRAVELTGSRAALLAVRHGTEFQVVASHPEPADHAAIHSGQQPLSGSENGDASTAESPATEQADQRPMRILESAFRDFITRHPANIVTGSADELLGREAASILGWTDCTVVRLQGAGTEAAGLLCLSGSGRPMDCEDRVFLETVAGHAAMALDNARLFTQIEQANRHWMEIFDAIADFIIVHDQSGNVLRVNRSLAAMIGVPPADLIGLNIRALLAINGDFAPYACPFCRAMAADDDEFVHPVFDRTFLVSTSRVHGAANEGLQTIHVLKDISDRREAERRYRELFDNIQEGLFFSTPQGRFVEVNDAMVRMLGYASREELLQIDI